LLGLVPLSLTALLVTLAVLQYRWLGELSANERRRMNTAARANVTSIARQFDDEIAAAANAVEIDADTLAQLDAGRVVARWDRWAATAPEPALVADVYVATADGPTLVLRRLDRTARTFVEVPWPASLARVPEVVARDFRKSVTSPQRWADGGVPAIFSRIVDVAFFTTTRDADVDALVKRLRGERAPRIRGYSITVLSFDAIADSLLPSIVRRYVTDDAYRVAVVRRSDRHVLWSSARGPVDDPDAAAGILAVTAPAVTIPLQRTAVLDSPTRPEARVIALGTARPSPPQWDLVIVHRDGSVDAAVTRVRRRNLAVGSSILAVLAAGMWFVLLYARRAEALARQQLDFVSAMSHELRTPVAVVSAAADNLARGVVDTRERGREYGEVLRREANRLSSMIEQVLEFARLRSVQRGTRLPFDLRDAVADAVDATSALAADAQRRLDVSLPDEPLMLAGDRAAVARATENLLVNAIKHGDGGTRIAVEVLARERHASVRVTDDGPGIPADEQRHLLEPFFRGRRAIDAQIPGSGLGLALVQRIAAAHRGRVTFESREGEGARFTMEFRR
jgi:signal transduction histidine kinase